MTSVTGGAQGSGGQPSFTDAITSSIGEGPVLINLVTGPNTITVPTGTSRVYMFVPSSNTQTITLKGVTGDAGIGLRVAGWLQLPIDTSVQVTFCVTAGGSIPAQFYYF